MPIKIHLLETGHPLCGFSEEVPRDWPLGHIWVRPSQYAANAAACRDPLHELHAVLRYKMCEECERVHLAREPPPFAFPPVAGRTCERCGVKLDPEHLAVYCTNECALADAVGPERAAEWIGELAETMARRLGADQIARVFPYGGGAPRCPDCEAMLVEGPHGGLSVNWYCLAPDCGSRFNFLGHRAELGIERISAAKPNTGPRVHVTEMTFGELGKRLDALVSDGTEASNRFRDAIAQLFRFESIMATATGEGGEGRIAALQRAVSNAELDGLMPEFYALCFRALLAAAEEHGPRGIGRARLYLDMAEAAADSEIERSIVGAHRSALARFERRGMRS